MKYSKFPISIGAVAVSALFAFSPAIGQSNQDGAERIEVAFVIDTTGSMANLIEGAKRKIWSIANTVVDINPDAEISMALIAYRDFGDQYVVKTYNMSPDIQGLYGNLLKFRANGGGDTPEAVNEALDASIKKIQWTMGSKTRRIVFLVGDAPPHMDYNGPKYPEIIRHARSSGISIHAVQAGKSSRTRKIWKEIAALGGGTYIPIPQSGGQITVIETPYDDEIILLQRRLDDTIIPYGNQKRRASLHQKLRTRSSAGRSVRVENSKFYAKRGKRKEVVTGGGDLIADIKNKDVVLGKIKREELPEEIRALDADGQKTYISRKIAERSALEKEMEILVKKHDGFSAKKAKESAGTKTADSFDKAVSRALLQH